MDNIGINLSEAPFFRSLPLEIRFQIYDYVITDDGHAVVIKVSGRDEPARLFRLYPYKTTKRRDNYGLNQLRLVCRQSHRETSGYGLRHNVLHFQTITDSTTCAATCVQFLKSCSHTHLASIRKIRILDVGGAPLIPHQKQSPWDNSTGRWDFGLFDLEAIPKLARFCVEYPRSSVEVVLPRLDARSNFHGFYLAVSALLLAVRKRNMDFPPPPDDVHLPVQAISRVWSGYSVEAEPLPANMRFYPNCQLRKGDAEMSKDQPWWKAFEVQVHTWNQFGI